MASSRSTRVALDDPHTSTEADPWAEMVWRECQQDLALKLNVSAADVRPCLARIGVVSQGIRNKTAYIVATEFRRMGAAEALAWREMLRWNGLCKPPLPERELRSAFESAWRLPKVYGCRGALADAWCIGRKKCEWFAASVAGRRKCRETDLFDYGWPGLLKSAEFRVYLSLVRLEQAKGVGAGGLVIAGTRDYAWLAGLHRGRVMAAFEGLERRKLLLVLERGERRSPGLPGMACQVQRIVPIPEPPVSEANRRREALCR